MAAEDNEGTKSWNLEECSDSTTSSPVTGSKRSRDGLVWNCSVSPPNTDKQSLVDVDGTSSFDDDVDGATHSKKPKVNDEELHLTPSLSSFVRYAMKEPLKGEFIIINNENFQLATEMDSRKGSSIDASNLAKDFGRLGFKIKQYKDLTVEQMLQVVKDAAKRATTDADCFGVAVLSHGDNDVLYGIDGIISIEEFVYPIKTCAALLGKPKIFIFQACRGNRLDKGADVTDGPHTASKIPLEADIIYAYSTVPCYFSWRNVRDGSWFIQALHRTMQQFFSSSDPALREVDFVRLLTRVSHEVAYEFQSMSTKPEMHGMKQVPSIVSMLTKDLIFKRPS